MWLDLILVLLTLGLFYQNIIKNQKYIADSHDPNCAQHAATTNYVDRRVLKFGDTMTDVLNMNSNWIITLSPEILANDAVNRAYVDGVARKNAGLLPKLIGSTGEGTGHIASARSTFNAQFAPWREWNFNAQPLAISSGWAALGVDPNSEW